MWVQSHLYLNAAAFAGFANSVTSAPVAIMMLAANRDVTAIKSCVATIQATWPECQIIGSTTRGLIMDGEDIFDGISLTLLGSDTAEVEAIGVGLASIEEQRGKVACELLMAKCALPDAQMMLTFSTLDYADGLQFSNEIDNRFNKLRLVGGSSCNLENAAPTVWHGNRMLENGLAALVINGSCLALETKWFSGLKSLGTPLTVDGIDGQYAKTLEGYNIADLLQAMFGKVLQKHPDVFRQSLPWVSERGSMPMVNQGLDLDAQKGLKTEIPWRRGEGIWLHVEHPGRVYQALYDLAVEMSDQPVSGILYFSGARRLQSHFRVWQESKMLQPFGPVSGGWLDWHFAWNQGRNRIMTETASMAFIGAHDREQSLQNIVPADALAMPEPDRREHLLFEMLIDAVDLGWRNWVVQRNRKKSNRIRYETVLENMSDGVSILSADGVSIYESATNKDIHGFDADTLTGRNFLEVIVHKDDRARLAEEWDNMLRYPKEVRSVETRCVTKDGKTILVQARIRNCLAEDNVQGVIVMFRDITDIRRIEDELRRQATIDSLTGVANRRHFSDTAERELSRARRYERPLSFIIFDIDHFKRFNDNYGHQTGDDVLILVASLVSTMLRKTDFIGRLGGEEFGILLPETPLHGALEKAEQLRAIIESEPLQVGEENLTITASFGVGELAPNELADALIHRADMALYDAKNAGRNRVSVTDTPS